ncbi:Npt1/Npt2 family nucleotide transporter [Parachlamydia sp. AcF125]|uniref:Npt1/Npt2 family nucleotide transporter n=1 Tax=Parachlamydia sp. AcF125 TaxID=2795736 RepID=UPI001BC9E8B1|nr:Npt1/Npt2 family nucleotide transporter [Parachlamydia sp. AcF125]MBS4167568.1 ADP,ATP carrier protein 1 [Parachlamydia sp. AcF125]
MTQPLLSEFGPLRSIIWPIHAHELKRIVPLLLMLFLICFNYTVLRNMKDAVVITASGAEVIPFIKVWVMLPMAVLTTYLFTKLANRYSQEQVFYIVMATFLLFYALFAFIIYPQREALHFHQAADFIEQYLPTGFRGLISMFRYWSFTVFYVISEMWSNIVMTVLFWGFVNEITKINEASRFYGVLSAGANISAIIAGQAAIYISKADGLSLPFGNDPWEQSVMTLVLAVIISGIGAMTIFKWMNQNVLNDADYKALHSASKPLKKKKKLSLRESFGYLSKSQYLLYIAIIVVAYNLVINLIEVVWKDQVKQLYPSPTDFNVYMNNLASVTGIVSTFMSFFMARIINRLGWTKTALITPIVMGVTCGGFFTFLFFQDHLGGMVYALTGFAPLTILVFFGFAQNCLSKAAKYSVFDATKEMAFIPLEHDLKLKGKAAIDGVGSRLGKSGGSLIHQGLLMLFGTFSSSAPFVAGILMGMIVLWITASRALGKQFVALTHLEEEGKPQPTLKAKDQPAIA